jgi:hypothetical protein
MNVDVALRLMMTVSRRSLLPDDSTLQTLLQEDLFGREATYHVEVTTHGQDVEIRVLPRPNRAAKTLALLTAAAHNSPAAETVEAP